MSRHFHGQSRMRGGFTVDESTLSDDDGYWQSFAVGTLKALDKLTPDADALVAEFWNESNSWKTICEKVEAVIAGVREQSPSRIWTSYTPPEKEMDKRKEAAYRAVWIASGGSTLRGTLTDLQAALDVMKSLRKYGRIAWVEDEECDRVEEVKREGEEREGEEQEGTEASPIISGGEMLYTIQSAPKISDDQIPF